MGLVKQGARVAVIERYQNVGAVAPTGAPSRRKLSVTPSADYRIQSKPTLQRPFPTAPLFFADILNHADNVINQQTRMRQDFTNVITVKYCRETLALLTTYVGAGLPGRQR